MKKFINGIGAVLLTGLCFVGARTVVQSLFESTDNGIPDFDTVQEEASSNGIPDFDTLREEASSNGILDFDTFREEASSSGVSPEAAEEVINDIRDLVDSGDFSRLEDAYGGISGTELQISQQLDADPQRREIVGKVMVEMILESMEVPIQLDEATILTGISYEVATSAVVYHYTATADLSWMTDEALEDLRDELEALNPDATCRVSLSLLKQGFDMVYSYRTVAGDEMFRVTRDYEGCQSLGFS